MIGVVTSLFIATLKEDEAVKRTRRLREMLANGFEKLVTVFDMNFNEEAGGNVSSLKTETNLSIALASSSV